MAVDAEELGKAVAERIAKSKQQDEELTMRQLRRHLEKDLGLPGLALDKEKAYIKECVEKALLADAGQSQEAETGPEKGTIPAREKDPTSREAMEEGQAPETDHGMNGGTGPKRRLKKLQPQGEEVGEKRDGGNGRAGETHSEKAEGLLKRRRLNTTAEDSDLEEGREDAHRKTGGVKRAAENCDGKHGGKANGKEEEEEEEEEEDEEEDANGREYAEEDGERRRAKPSDVKKSRAKAKPAPSAKAVYGARVEHLKEVIQACGLKIAPQVYRKAKQAPQGKGEHILVKELEAILQKEGLDSNPSEKEVKATRKKLQRQKDLEGIDVSNIVDQPRGRRRTGIASFAMPASNTSSRGGDEDGEDGEEDEEEEEDDDEDNEEDFDGEEADDEDD